MVSDLDKLFWLQTQADPDKFVCRAVVMRTEQTRVVWLYSKFILLDTRMSVTLVAYKSLQVYNVLLE